MASTAALAERLVGEGFLTYDELSVIEPDALMAMGNLTEEQVQHIVDQAEAKAEEAEAAAAAERRRQREQERIDAATAEADKKEAELATNTASPEEAGKVGDSNGSTPEAGSGETAVTGGESAAGGSN